MMPLPPQSLISEDLRGVPGSALENALARLAVSPDDPQAQLDACLAALSAGEAKRALSLLAASRQSPRVTAALVAWARMLDGNRYPGGVGAETAGTVLDAGVPITPGAPFEMLLEQVAMYGPAGLATTRTLIEHTLRGGNLTGVQQAVTYGITGLQMLGNTAVTAGQPAIAQWATLAGADLFHRAGMPDQQPWLQQARAMAAEPAQFALTLMIEGDWHAAPGSSPEAMGWDLAPMDRPSPLGRSDVANAAALWESAAAAIAAPGAAPPALMGALALRRALVARANGDAAGRRRELDAAEAAFRTSGDTSALQLVGIHRMIADIEDGALGGHALELGGGWRRPERGPVADAIGWAETVGSRSWAIGLSRLLERSGAAWTAAGSVPRARIAYLGALALATVESSFPSRTLVTAVARADAATNLATNSLLRLERGFASLFARPDDPDPFSFAQRLEASLVMVGALRSRARGPGADPAADRLDLLRTQLAAALGVAEGRLGDAVPMPDSPDELQAVFGAHTTGTSLEDQAAASERGFQLMRRMQLDGVRQQLSTIDVLSPLARADAARQTGRDGEARRWADAAVDAARRPGVAGYLLPLALVSARRLDEARAALGAGQTAGTVPDEFVLPLALRADDPDAAAAALARLVAAGRPPTDWPTLLSQAEVELATGRADSARQTVDRAIELLEASVSLLLRDPERLDACDQPDVAALYSTLALALVEIGDVDASFDAVERLRHLTSVDAASLAGTTAPEGGGQAWRLAAASYSAAANSLLAELPAVPPGELDARFADLDAVDHALASAELALDAASPGILLRRASPPAPPSVADIRARMPADALLLDYVAVGDDLLAWAVTRDAVQQHAAKLGSRELAAMVRAFHAACSEGRGGDTPLAELLLAPFGDLLRGHGRIVVVPFGPLTLVPFHALRVDGVPLGASHVVSYATRASDAFREGLDEPARRTRPLVVGDPAFDAATRPGLARLPGSAAEAHAVSTALGAGDLLVGAEATEAAVTARLDGCDLLHVSSHGHLDEQSPFASSLVLAGPDELTVAEISGARFSTDLAVLTGCDTGRGAATLGGDLVGLTRSLLRSGVRRAIVSLWPVDDAVAAVLMRALYDGLAADLSPADALARAQRSVAAMDAAALEAACREAGADGSVGARGTRRGLGLDPELADDEEVPDAVGGDAERYWAPFILVT